MPQPSIDEGVWETMKAMEKGTAHQAGSRPSRFLNVTPEQVKRRAESKNAKRRGATEHRHQKTHVQTVPKKMLRSIGWCNEIAAHVVVCARTNAHAPPLQGGAESPSLHWHSGF